MKNKNNQREKTKNVQVLQTCIILLVIKKNKRNSDRLETTTYITFIL